MTEEKTKEVKIKETIVDLLRTLESDVIHSQCQIAMLLKLFGEEPYSEKELNQKELTNLWGLTK